MIFKATSPTVRYLKSEPKECLALYVEHAFPDGLFCPGCDAYVDDLPADGNGRRVRCAACKKRFDVFEGSMIEFSRLELHAWLSIMFNSVSRERISGHQLADLLGCEYSRIRYAIKAVDRVKSQLVKQSSWYRSSKFLALIRGCMVENSAA